MPNTFQQKGEAIHYLAPRDHPPLDISIVYYILVCM